jgi:uncharacterized domain 1
VIWQH